jgi:hypothetical protein
MSTSFHVHFCRCTFVAQLVLLCLRFSLVSTHGWSSPRTRPALRNVLMRCY